MACLRHDDFVAPGLAPDAIISVARLALVKRGLRTRGGPPAGVDEGSLFINRMFRGGVGFASCVPVSNHQVEPALNSGAGGIIEVRECAITSHVEELLNVD